MLTRRAFTGLAATNILAHALRPMPALAQVGSAVSLDGYDLVFDSDFTPLGQLQGAHGSRAGDLGQWTPRYRFTDDPRGCSFHGEWQWYVDPRFDWGAEMGRISPFAVEDGVLSITAKRASAAAIAKLPRRLDVDKRVTPDPYPWMSGVITTQDSFWFRYGFAEAMVKLPRGQALWPAFWMLPKEWPYPPEIDIMEFISQEPRKTNYAVHPGTQDNPLPGGGDFSDRGSDLTNDWHAFGCLWTPEAFVFAIDRKIIGRLPAYPTTADCHFYLVANMAVGGKWPGEPTSETPSPSRFQIRYIKVWQNKALLQKS